MRRYLTSAVFVLCACLPVTAQDQSAPKFTIPALVKDMSPGVVHIAVLKNTAGKTASYGSGFIIDPSGTIVTAYHVIRGAANATVTTADGESYDRVEVVQYDLRRDIAILRIQPFRPLKALRLAADDSVVTGEDIAAIGNPQGLDASVSAGIISGYRQAEGYRMLQTTAPVSPGSSGGPLFDMFGGVVGMVTSAVDNTQGQNLNFAVPVIYIRTLLKTESAPLAIAEFTKRVAASPLSALGPNRGGVTSSEGWQVKHAHSSFDAVCTGTLSLSEGRLVFTSDVAAHSLDVPLYTVTDIAQNQVMGVGLQAFHIRFADGTNLNFRTFDGASGASKNPSPIISAVRFAKGR